MGGCGSYRDFDMESVLEKDGRQKHTSSNPTTFQGSESQRRFQRPERGGGGWLSRAVAKVEVEVGGLIAPAGS